MQDINDIMRLLPHRYPFLLVDRVLETNGVDKLIAIKNVTVNEPQFTGHFPGVPVMPGVLIIEAMAQACAMLAFARMAAKEIRTSSSISQLSITPDSNVSSSPAISSVLNALSLERKRV